MNSVEIAIRLSKTILTDVKSVTVTTSTGIVQFVPDTPAASGAFSTTHSNPAPGKFAILTEVPPDGLESSPGPVDDPGHP
jgi:hypothetical protein